MATSGLKFSNGAATTTRLANVFSGLCLAEISLLASQPRTADLIADTDGRCLLLRRQARTALRPSTALCQRRPDGEIALLGTFSSELGSKLAIASHQLTLAQHS